MADDSRSPWRQPMVWLVIAVPAASIVAGVGLIVAASRSSGSDDAVRDPVRRTAQVQQSYLGADELASRRRLGAVLRVDRGFIEIVPTTGDFDRDAPLELALGHPVRATGDAVLRAQPSANGWRATHALDGSHDWTLTLTGEAGRWRLVGRLPKGQRAAHLAPSLPAR